MILSANQIQPIRELYENGLYLQAHAAALQLAPLQDWQGTDAKVLAGRMSYALGATRQAQRLHLSAWRHDRPHAEALYFYLRAVMDRKGALRAWRILKSVGEILPNATVQVQADWYGLHAQVLGTLRDFDRAEAALAKAEACDPNEPYVWVERAGLLEMEDRYAEALEAAKHALSVRPWYRPAIQSAAHLLILLQREQDALALLQAGKEKTESGSIVGQLAQLQSDLEMFEEARANWELFAERMPLLDDEDQRWFNARRSDAAYHCGDFDAALAFAEKAQGYFYKRIAENLGAAQKRASNNKRVSLPVNFIRQHHMTCAPATLTMISRYWQRQAAHLDVAEQICYGGTTDYSERKWAMEQGYETREFCVNLADAVKLIDRGIPFTLATVDPGNAHLQCVNGYDQRRGTLMLRDPYVSSLGEALAEELVKHYRSSGPRGMALVPVDQADKLGGLELKDADLYDRVFEIQGALDRHDRESAQAAWDALQAAWPAHRLTHWSRLVIAWYDDDNAQVLANVEKLLLLFPEDANLKMSKIYALRTLSRSAERQAYLAELCAWRKPEDPQSGKGEDALASEVEHQQPDVFVAQPGAAQDEKMPDGKSSDNTDDEELSETQKKDPTRYFDPLFWQQYAEELSNDGRMHGKALKLLQRVLRYRPSDAHSIYILANILWAQRRFEDATELYRFAACLKDTNEHYVHSYFIATRHLRQTQNALEHLESRFKRFGKRNSSPARTYSSALEQVGDDVRSLTVLDEALAMRPDDGELWLYASDAQARNGNFEKAAEYLKKAEGKAPRTAIWRGAALIAFYRGALAEALPHWRNVLEAEPQAIDATRNTARLLAETEGRAASVEFLQVRAERFPHNYLINQQLVEALREEPAEAEKALRRLLEIDPNEAWGRRELAYKLTELQRFDEALAEAAMARELEPQSPFSYCTLGTVQAAAGHVTDARATFKQALRLAVDTEYALNELMELAHTPGEKRDALAVMAEELTRQVTFGEGLLAYRQHARATLPADEVLALLQRALTARPDLPLAWTAIVQQLVDMERLDEALSLAEQATQRFPLVPRLWLDLSIVQQVRLNTAGEVDALQQALRISPKWGYASQQLSEALLRAGEKQKAKEVLERAITLAPLDAYSHGCLADVLWKLNEKEAALARVQQSLKLEPSYEWGWRALRDWSLELKKTELAVECARDLTVQRPGQAGAWLTLARTITDGRKLDERIAAIDRALALQPRMIEAHTLKARLYTEAHQFEAARAACRPAVFDADVPADLRIVAANVEAERGAINDAVKLLRELVTDEPNYYPAWAQLADWYRSKDDHGNYREACETMARLQPHYPIALGYLAEARQLTLDRPGAKEALQRALQLDPMYEYAAATLFDWQFEDKEWEACATTIAHLKEYFSGDAVHLRELKLALHNEDFQMARQRLQELATSTTEDRAALDEAVAAGADTPPPSYAARWKTEIDSVLDYVVEAQMPNANALVIWVERNAKLERYDKVQGWLESLPDGPTHSGPSGGPDPSDQPEGPDSGELWRRGSVAYLEALANAGKKHRFRKYVKQYREALHANDWAWGNVGFFYLEMGEPRTAVEWLSDWRARQELEPWMLWNLVLALRLRKQVLPTYEVSEKALTLPPDTMSDAHALLLSVEDFLAGRYESGCKRIEHINVSALRAWDRYVYELATALQDADHAQSSQGISHRSILERISDARQNFNESRSSVILIALHRRVVWHIAQTSQSPWLLFRTVCQLGGQIVWRSILAQKD